MDRRMTARARVVGAGTAGGALVGLGVVGGRGCSGEAELGARERSADIADCGAGDREASEWGGDDPAGERWWAVAAAKRQSAGDGRECGASGAG